MQQQLMQMQMQQPTTTGAFNTSTITTDYIQQYLDENKVLILKILENQNSGKLRECAENQTKLQRNLMYLAAIADSQPKPTSVYMQPPINYMQHQQSSHIVSQSHMLSQSPMMFAQPQQPQQPQAFSALQQQASQTQLGINSAEMTGLQTPRSMTGMGGEGPGAYIDFSQSSFAEGGKGMSRQAQHSRNEENRSASSAEDEGNNPNKQGRFNRETNN